MRAGFSLRKKRRRTTTYLRDHHLALLRSSCARRNVLRNPASGWELGTRRLKRQAVSAHKLAPAAITALKPDRAPRRQTRLSREIAPECSPRQLGCEHVRERALAQVLASDKQGHALP